MFDKFSDYMQYLLPAAFKKQKKQNQLLIYCKVVSKLYDSLLQMVLRLREETMLATCSPEMLEVFGRDYDMPKMRGETDEMYRKRLKMKAVIAEKAGTQKGILYALESVGYDKCTITPFYQTDSERWAEIRINIFTPSIDIDNPVAFKCVRAEVMKVKKASTLPHWRFYYPLQIWHTDINRIQAVVRFILFVQFWGDCIYNGQNDYDDALRYDTKRNYRTSTWLINRMHTYTEQSIDCISASTKIQIQNQGRVVASVRSYYNISYWGCAVYNGQNNYDDALQYDAVRRYGIRIATLEKAAAYTMQRIRYRQYILHVQLVDREQIKAGGIKNRGYKVEEPRCRKKSSVRICMEIVFPKEKIDNVYVETSRHVAYYNGDLCYGGTAKYDALYKKEKVE